MDSVVIGAGANGLTAAFYLARAGFKPVVCERRAAVGGGLVTQEFAPGFRGPALANAIAPLAPSLVADMALERRGVRFIAGLPRLTALSPDGKALTVWADDARTCASIQQFSNGDARRYPEFIAALGRLAAFIAPLLDEMPPPVDDSSAAGLWKLIEVGRRFRALSRADAFRLLRWIPMAVADVAAEWFSSDLLQAAVAARGIAGAAMGPWSAGTGAALLMNSALDPVPGGVMAVGGPGALTSAMADAAREAGVEIRTNAAVTHILVRDGRTQGVVLENGSQIDARTVISSADPKHTFLQLVDPVDLDPAFLAKARNYRCPGVVANVNLALSALPSFPALADQPGLGAIIRIAPGIDYLERAFDNSKYGEISSEPFLDATIPSLHDPSLAPDGRHVMSIQMQYAPFRLSRGREWNAERASLCALAIDTLEHYAPRIRPLVIASQAITPVDLQEQYGMTGGHVLHGEPSLDQLFAMRPIFGWSQYRTPIQNLFLCGAGTHPAGAVTGASGRNAARQIVRTMKKQAGGS